MHAVIHVMHIIHACHVQAQASLDEEPDVYQQQPTANSNRHFTRQDSASSSAVPGKEAAAGFKGAFKKVANGIAGVLQHSSDEDKNDTIAQTARMVMAIPSLCP